MSIGTLFFIVAVVFFFLAAVGSTFLPNPQAWGFVSLALGLLTSGYAIRSGTVVRT